MRARWLFVVLIAIAVAATASAGCREAARERLGLGLAPPMSVAFIVHGAPDDPFWDIVRTGATDAAAAFDVNLAWRSSPDGDERRRLIDEALQQGFDTIVVTLVDPEAVSGVVEEAVLIGTTVYVINVGAELVQALGAASYFGQVEAVAGLAVGDRLKEVGVSKVLCVVHEQANIALDARCERAGFRIGAMDSLQIDPDNPDPETVVSWALQNDPEIDAVLSMSTALYEPVLNAVESARRDGRQLVYAVFELDDEVLDGIERGQVLFAVDQQAYLQGYLPIAYSRLNQYAEVSQGDELADALLQWIAGGGIFLGPAFVDVNNAERVRDSRR